MTVNENEIKVSINGTYLESVLSLKILTDVRSVFSWCAMDLSYNSSDEFIFTPFAAQKVEVTYNDQVVFTGIVERLSKTTKQGHIHVSGRSKTADLAICNFTNNYTFQETTLKNIVSTICDDYGIEVVSDYDSEEFAKVNFHVGKNIFSQLSMLASKTSLNETIPLLSANANGELVIGKNIPSSSQLVYQFTEENENIYDMSVLFDIANLMYKHKRFSQTMQDLNIESLDVTNDLTNQTQRLDYAICDGASIGECTNLAKFKRALAISEACNIEIVVPRWTDKNDNILDTGSLISIKNSDCMINDTQTFLIESIEYSYGQSGFNAKMKATFEDTYKAA